MKLTLLKFCILITYFYFLSSSCYAEDKNIMPKKALNKTTLTKTGKTKKIDNSVTPFGSVNNNQVYGVSNYPENIDESSSSVQVIKQNKIDLLNPLTIESLLGTSPGIIINRYGSIGNYTPYSIRGWDRSLLTIDGIKFNDPIFGTPRLNPLLMDSIERIEIIRGPQATMHGTQSHGGLVALYTNKGSGRPKIEMSGGFGNCSTFRENFVFDGGNENIDYYMGIIRLDTTGGAPTLLNQSENDDYGNFTVVSNIGKRLLKGKAELRNTFSYSTAEKEQALQLNGFPVFDPDDENNNSLIFNNLTYTHNPYSWYDYNIRFVTLNSIFKDYDNDKSLNFNFTKAKNNRLMFLTQHNFKVKDINTLSIGYELEYNDYESIDVNDIKLDKDITKNDIFFYDSLNIKDRLFIRGGARITDYNLFGTYVTPNISAALKLPFFKLKDSYTKIKSSYGYSIYEPTPYQLFGMFGNPDLVPEQSFGWDIGIDQSILKDIIHLECNYFRNKVENIIARNPDIKTMTLENISKAKISGWEASLTLTPIKSIKAEVNYTYINARQWDLTSANYDPIDSVPNNSWNFIVSYIPKEDYGIYFKGTTSSTRPGIDYNTFLPGKTKGFMDLGIGAQIRLIKKKGYKLIWFGQMTNIADERYEQVLGYKHDGFRFMTGLKLTKSF